MGELITRPELFAIYDAGISWREETTFEEFLQIRLRVKSDCYFLGKEIFKNDFAECHREWTDWFPKFNPLTLVPNHTQRQAIQWLSDQSPDVKDFLMLASRNAFKSSWVRCWAVSLILCHPSVRILFVSETRPLSKDFLGALRAVFEVQSGMETRFQRLFPEFCIALGDGSSLEFECPMKHLRLAQGISSTSTDSNVAGGRFDVGIFDDFVSNTNCGNETQIAASMKKHDFLVKLREVGGLILRLGTPYEPNDPYYQLLERAKKNHDATFAFRIDPAFEVKPSARFKLTPELLPTLTEEDITSYLFPERLNWKFLSPDMKNSPQFFMSQNLVIFPKAEDEGFKVQFDEDDLRNHTRPLRFFDNPVNRVVMAIDRAWSVSRYADYSCLAVGKITQYNRKDICAILDVNMDRWRESELVINIIQAIERHSPTALVMQKDRGWEEFGLAIRKAAMLRGVVLPHFIWKDIPSSAQAKAKRVKILELPVHEDRLWFVSAEWNDSVFLQFTKFDGLHGSNSHRKDDAPDAISLLFETFMPRRFGAEEEQHEAPDAEKSRQREEEQARENLRLHHQRMFGPNTFQPKPDEPDQLLPKPKLTPFSDHAKKILGPGWRV